MKKLTIDKPGKSKQDLLNSLEKLKTNFASQIKEFDLNVSPVTDGYELKGSKKILFVDFSVDLKITAEDGRFNIFYDTKNVPQSKIDSAIVQVKDVLKKY